MSEPSADPALYRPAVGVAIFNKKGQVWLGQRRGGAAKHGGGDYVWQMPQGGMDPGESPEFAAMREMEEETGIRLYHIEPLGRIGRELFYDFPDGYKLKKGKNWRGQRQYWFAVRFTGKAKDVDLKAHQPHEFSKWKWENLAKTPELIVPFKRSVYGEIAREFAPFAKPVK